MADGERRKLILTEEDMADATPSSAVVQPQEPPRARAAAPLPRQPPAQEFPVVGGVGAARRQVTTGAPAQPATPALPGWLNVNTVKGRSVVAAAAGIALGWLVSDKILGLGEAGNPFTTTKFDADVRVGEYVGVIGLVFAIVYAGWDHIVARSWDGVLRVARTSGPVGAGLGFVSGVVAQIIFAELTESIISGGDFTYYDVRLYLARALAWGLFGMGMGAASAVLIRSSRKLVNGLVGGAIGGALGGLVFHWIVAKMPESQGTARLIGLLIVGAGIGLAIGLIETARREAWLNVVGGGMTGKEFIIYAAETKIGSDPKCEIVLIKDPAIQPYHFIINTPAGAGPQRRTLTAYQGCQVTIQGQPVAQHVLRDGDVIGLGTTAIRYAERAAPQPLASSI